jgi:hypothetical protein
VLLRFCLPLRSWLPLPFLVAASVSGCRFRFWLPLPFLVAASVSGCRFRFWLPLRFWLLLPFLVLLRLVAGSVAGSWPRTRLFPRTPETSPRNKKPETF